MGGLGWMMPLGLVVVLCAAAAGTIREPETGRTFDTGVKGVSPGVTLTCTGAGCRKKTAFAVKLYAIAHWIDAPGARSATAVRAIHFHEKLADDSLKAVKPELVGRIDAVW